MLDNSPIAQKLSILQISSPFIPCPQHTRRGAVVLRVPLVLSPKRALKPWEGEHGEVRQRTKPHKRLSPHHVSLHAQAGLDQRQRGGSGQGRLPQETQQDGGARTNASCESSSLSKSIIKSGEGQHLANTVAGVHQNMHLVWQRCFCRCTKRAVPFTQTKAQLPDKLGARAMGLCKRRTLISHRETEERRESN